ncbi:hypothetical protein HanXRQr2_Chr17g0823881 [Helianthus annuus]|uniref:Uncharacterized protein n=1 Tax=Helianthus annuus TaxID=4232 RepID=A0A9K3GW68_HELAN|nr:hypothetical protein HanXRQr2_Chr17g0823881 [Helianthus annuus]KAJ0637722.1 hypothetical protein HanOQP8_Chr17g0677081 [Helianthus annuus]
MRARERNRGFGRNRLLISILVSGTGESGDADEVHSWWCCLTSLLVSVKLNIPLDIRIMNKCKDCHILSHDIDVFLGVLFSFVLDWKCVWSGIAGSSNIRHHQGCQGKDPE